MSEVIELKSQLLPTALTDRNHIVTLSCRISSLALALALKLTAGIPNRVCPMECEQFYISVSVIWQDVTGYITASQVLIFPLFFNMENIDFRDMEKIYWGLRTHWNLPNMSNIKQTLEYTGPTKPLKGPFSRKTRFSCGHKVAWVGRWV